MAFAHRRPRPRRERLTIKRVHEGIARNGRASPARRCHESACRKPSNDGFRAGDEPAASGW